MQEVGTERSFPLPQRLYRSKSMSVQRPRYSATETAQRGDAIYEQAIRPQVEATDYGRAVCIQEPLACSNNHAGWSAAFERAYGSARSDKRGPRNAGAVWYVEGKLTCCPTTPCTGLSPARCACSPVKAGVAMTSNVKGREQLFLGLHQNFHLCACNEAEPVRDDG